MEPSRDENSVCLTSGNKAEGSASESREIEAHLRIVVENYACYAIATNPEFAPGLTRETVAVARAAAAVLWAVVANCAASGCSPEAVAAVEKRTGARAAALAAEAARLEALFDAGALEVPGPGPWDFALWPRLAAQNRAFIASGMTPTAFAEDLFRQAPLESAPAGRNPDALAPRSAKRRR